MFKIETTNKKLVVHVYIFLILQDTFEGIGSTFCSDARAQRAPGPSHSRGFQITQHSWYDSSGRGIGKSQRLIPYDTTLTTDIHASGWTRTHVAARERPQTFALDRAVTGIGKSLHLRLYSRLETFQAIEQKTSGEISVQKKF